MYLQRMMLWLLLSYLLHVAYSAPISYDHYGSPPRRSARIKASGIDYATQDYFKKTRNRTVSKPRALQEEPISVIQVVLFDNPEMSFSLPTEADIKGFREHTDLNENLRESLEKVFAIDSPEKLNPRQDAAVREMKRMHLHQALQFKLLKALASLAPKDGDEGDVRVLNWPKKVSKDYREWNDGDMTAIFEDFYKIHYNLSGEKRKLKQVETDPLIQNQGKCKETKRCRENTESDHDDSSLQKRPHVAQCEMEIIGHLLSICSSNNSFAQKVDEVCMSPLSSRNGKLDGYDSELDLLFETPTEQGEDAANHVSEATDQYTINDQILNYDAGFSSDDSASEEGDEFFYWTVKDEQDTSVCGKVA